MQQVQFELRLVRFARVELSTMQDNCSVAGSASSHHVWQRILSIGWLMICSTADGSPPREDVPPVAPYALWDDAKTLAPAADLPVLADIRFSVIKPYEFAQDGYRFLHGVALCFHRGKLYASFGHNRGGENTDTEEARYRVSDDEGRTWGPVQTIDAGNAEFGVSHGVFLSHEGRLWALHGAFQGILENVHTRAYVLQEPSGTWEPQGVVMGAGFWPMQAPLKMTDGNWIVSGIRVGDGNPAAVARSDGDNLANWNVVVIPAPPGITMWGESSVLLDGSALINIARYGGEARALVATSADCGRSWSEMRPSNLPLAGSKPYAGTLSTGEHYLIGTTTADSGHRRAPLTIALTRPGENRFSRVRVIRQAEFPAGPGESHPQAALAYPYAVEHHGHLYVGYSNNGGNAGRVGEGRQLWNNNSAELAVIPLSSLAH
ncbi:MAG: glycoside hydrolase [Pirellulaceae bacterium]|nr:glycoside hydrolase [Pirellulaceae bacterium]